MIRTDEDTIVDDRIFGEKITIHEIIEKLKRFRKENPNQLPPLNPELAKLLGEDRSDE